MSRASKVKSVFLLLLLAAATPVEYEGAGEATIIGGNLVSARKRAMKKASEDAVTSAVVTMTSPEKLNEAGDKLNSSIHQRYHRYIRSYRVLEESQEDRVFRIRIAVKLDGKRLLRDLKRIVGDASPVHPPSSESRRRIGLRLTVEAPDAVKFRQLFASQLEQALQAAGFDPVQDDAVRLIASATLMVAAEEGVRGMDLVGARAEISITAANLVRRHAVDWGMGDSMEQAARMAVQRVLKRTLPQVVRDLGERWPARKVKQGERMVVVSNVKSFDQYRAIRSALTDKIVGVQGCVPRRMSHKEVSFSVRTEIAVRDLADALAGQSFQGFKLNSQRIEGGSAWLTIMPYPASQPTSGQ